MVLSIWFLIQSRVEQLYELQFTGGIINTVFV